MNTKLAAFLIAILALLAVLNTIRSFKRNRLSARLLFMWLFIWVCIGFFSLFPSPLKVLMSWVGMGNKLFFLTTGAIILLYVVIFYVSSSLSNMRLSIARLTQELALLRYELEEKKDAPQLGMRSPNDLGK